MFCCLSNFLFNSNAVAVDTGLSRSAVLSTLGKPTSVLSTSKFTILFSSGSIMLPFNEICSIFMKAWSNVTKPPDTSKPAPICTIPGVSVVASGA